METALIRPGMGQEGDGGGGWASEATLGTAAVVSHPPTPKHTARPYHNKFEESGCARNKKVRLLLTAPVSSFKTPLSPTIPSILTSRDLRGD